ncbi:MAG: ACP S-malonyltransferase [Cryomorphaceae bacterium]|jgi:[acyl-carrier-protein] S-malonyltransferase|nr:ACP S-malonyltransferase [Cryomorphaceae bacterium]MBT3689364.1 ACP S-malonyltransferase [Cryomorphaceae bacterium]MBT4222393.1 ACP S-malonyltransferase [Cryomorphaceae bacterium]MBT4518176.1 ACP S-malonyltransferase [Cryomorphaceae bacterium]MBT5936488.1 ACP S-malonyltransferase [Cryomorphaceae bacterium]
MKAYVFPGQGSQKPGMGQEIFNEVSESRDLFKKANKILNFNITELMFEGSSEDLSQTKVTQPAIFIHSVISALTSKSFEPNVCAGHSLGEFSALVVSNSISFEDGLKLVSIRANAMQKACQETNGTMAAILGLADNIVESTCNEIEGIVNPANYNCPGQLVISGEVKAVKEACELLKEKGAKRALILSVGGAFHSELMSSAADELKKGIEKTEFKTPNCPIYQNFTSNPVKNPSIIKSNLLSQLTGAVLWTQSVNKMINDGVKEFYEVGPGNILQGLIRKIDNDITVGKI